MSKAYDQRKRAGEDHWRAVAQGASGPAANRGGTRRGGRHEAIRPGHCHTVACSRGGEAAPRCPDKAMRAVGIAMTLLSAAPLHSPGSSADGWHVIGFLMLVGGFVAFGYGRNIRRGGEPRF